MKKSSSGIKVSHMTSCAHYLRVVELDVMQPLVGNVYFPTGWQQFLEVAGFHWVKSDAKKVLYQKSSDCFGC